MEEQEVARSHRKNKGLMIIETKFDYDQEVWFRRGSTVLKGRVFSIEVSVHAILKKRVKYTIQYSEDDGVSLEESKVFATREEAEAYG